MNETFESESEWVPMVSDAQYDVILKVTVLAQVVFSVLGVFTNAVNIRVFVEQGVTSTSTNVGLFFLSLFDFFACFLLLAPQSCVALDFINDWLAKRFCFAYTVYNTFVYIIAYDSSNLTTVYLSVERFLCVMIPLKVKNILRPKVTVVIIVAIFVINFTGQMIYIASMKLVWFVEPATNFSFPFVLEKPFATEYARYYSLVGNVIVFAGAMLVVAITTGIMIRKLHQYQKWRQDNMAAGRSASTSTGNDAAAAAAETTKDNNKTKLMSSKDAEMVKTVTTVTCIYLVCLTAGHITPIAVSFFPEVTFTGRNHHLYSIGYITRFLFSLVNSSINVFFYLRISSRYKAAFATAFPRLSACLVAGQEK